MGFFDFVKDAGENILDLLTPGKANADDLKKHIENVGLGNPNIQTSLQGSTVVVTGTVTSQEEKEKILLALGNIKGVERVDDQITVSSSAAGGVLSATAARFVTVKPGDTLSAIAKEQYGDAGQYQKIFEANQPMLKNPNQIYPGQVLRIPD